MFQASEIFWIVNNVFNLKLWQCFFFFIAGFIILLMVVSCHPLWSIDRWNQSSFQISWMLQIYPAKRLNQGGWVHSFSFNFPVVTCSKHVSVTHSGLMVSELMNVGWEVRVWDLARSLWWTSFPFWGGVMIHLFLHVKKTRDKLQLDQGHFNWIQTDDYMCVLC